MKKILPFVLMFFAVFSVFANGSSEESDVVELELLISDDTLEGSPMAKAIARFNEEYKDKGIQVKMNEIAYADQKTQVLNRAKAQDLPDLIKTSDDNSFSDFVLPLDGLVDDSNFARSGIRQGELKVTPVNVTAVGLIINKTAFDQAGVSYPTTEEERWTWDEFLAALDQVVANSDCDYGLVIDHSQQRINTILYQFGYQGISQDEENVATISTAKKGLDFIKSLYDRGYSPVSAGLGTDNAQSMFKTGKVAAHIAGNWVYSDYTENITDFEWIPVLMPYQDAKATCLGGNYLFAFQGTGHEEEAVEFINWFYKPENYAQYCKDGNYLPGLTGIEVDYDVEGMEIFNMEINATSNAPEHDADFARANSGVTVGNCIRDAHDQLIAGEITSDEAVAYIQKVYKDTFPCLSVE